MDDDDYLEENEFADEFPSHDPASRAYSHGLRVGPHIDFPPAGAATGLVVGVRIAQTLSDFLEAIIHSGDNVDDASDTWDIRGSQLYLRPGEDGTINLTAPDLVIVPKDGEASDAIVDQVFGFLAGLAHSVSGHVSKSVAGTVSLALDDEDRDDWLQLPAGSDTSRMERFMQEYEHLAAQRPTTARELDHHEALFRRGGYLLPDLEWLDDAAGGDSTLAGYALAVGAALAIAAAYRPDADIRAHHLPAAGRKRAAMILSRPDNRPLTASQQRGLRHMKAGVLNELALRDWSDEGRLTATLRSAKPGEQLPPPLPQPTGTFQDIYELVNWVEEHLPDAWRPASSRLGPAR